MTTCAEAAIEEIIRQLEEDAFESDPASGGCTEALLANLPMQAVIVPIPSSRSGSILVLEDGSALVFASDQFLPDSPAGKRLLSAQSCFADALAASDQAQPSASLEVRIASAGGRAEYIARHEGSKVRFDQELEGILSELEDPIFRGQDRKSWGGDTELLAAEIMTLAWTTWPRFIPTWLTLYGGVEGSSAFLDSDLPPRPGNKDGEAALARTRRLLDMMVPLAGLTGVCWEFNDNAVGRESGYWANNPVVASVQPEQPSAHARISGMARLRALLTAAGHDPDEAALPKDRKEAK